MRQSLTSLILSILLAFVFISLKECNDKHCGILYELHRYNSVYSVTIIRNGQYETYEIDKETHNMLDKQSLFGTQICVHEKK